MGRSLRIGLLLAAVALIGAAPLAHAAPPALEASVAASAVALVGVLDLVRQILEVAWPFVLPVAASFLFGYLTKAVAWVNALGTWPKRFALILLNGLGALALMALGITGPGEFTLWDQTTIEAILGAVASMFLFDKGQATAAEKLKVG